MARDLRRAGRWLRWLEDHGDMENYPVVTVSFPGALQIIGPPLYHPQRMSYGQRRCGSIETWTVS